MIDSLSYRFTESLTDMDRRALFQLWNSHYPVELCYNDLSELEVYLDGLMRPRHILVHDAFGMLLGWLCTFERTGSEWFVIILHDQVQGKGLGRSMMEDVQASYASLKGWMVERNDLKRKDGSTYPSPAEFYEKLGFEIGEDSLEAKGLQFSQVKWP